MIDTLKLKGRIVEKNKTIQKLAQKVGCTPYTLGQKIANEAPLDIEEAMIICQELDIKDEEFASFFLQSKLHNATN